MRKENLNSDYSQANFLLNNMELHQELFIKVQTITSFRKYLSELIFKQKSNRQFATRKDKNSLRIVRIR